MENILGIIAIIVSVLALILSIISFFYSLKGGIVTISQGPIPNNLASTNTKKCIHPILYITNATPRTVSLKDFGANGISGLTVSVNLYENLKENPTIGYINIPSGETKRIMVNITGSINRDSEISFTYLINNKKKSFLLDLSELSWDSK